MSAIGAVRKGAFYECRDGTIVGPMTDADDGHFAAAKGADWKERWSVDGVAIGDDRTRDFVSVVSTQLLWKGQGWRRLDCPPGAES
jgi:hypothetical protein